MRKTRTTVANKNSAMRMKNRIPVKYIIVIPICFLVAVSNFFVAKTLSDSIASSKITMFTDKNVTNVKTITPILALSIWEYNVDRVASTLTGLDDGETFLFASVWADDLEFLFRGDRNAYDASNAVMQVAEGTPIGGGRYLIKGDVLTIFFPIVIEENNYDIGYLVTGFHLATLAQENQQARNYVNSIAALGTGVVLLGILVFSWLANRSLSSVASGITNIANGKLQTHVTLESSIAELQDIDLALHQLRVNAMQLIELQSQAKSDEKIRHMAMHDPLTNLANRRYFDNYSKDINDSWRSKSNDKKWLEVLHIDLDGFKAINDSYGHAAGDKLLQIASERLKKYVLKTGKIFRVGGDEFVVIRLHEHQVIDKAEVSYAFASGLTERLGNPYRLDDQIHLITASIGLVITDESTLNIDRLLSEADFAMYRAKSSGGNCFIEFTGELREAHNRKKQLARELDSALENWQIQPYYQPKVRSEDYAVCGAEALVRWDHPQLGVLTPDKFLGVAQELGLLVDVDRMLFKAVCADIKASEAAGIEMPPVSINLSASRLSDTRLIDDIVNADLKRGSISFELLETVYFDEVSDEVLDCLQAIREAGFQIELDDFGSGHASMISLLIIAPDRLKIDRSFIREMLANFQSEKIISKIVEIGKSLNIPSTAEGVESEEEAQRLAELGCDVLQGYYFGRPTDYMSFVNDYIYDANKQSGESANDADDDDLLWANAG